MCVAGLSVRGVYEKRRTQYATESIIETMDFPRDENARIFRGKSPTCRGDQRISVKSFKGETFQFDRYLTLLYEESSIIRKHKREARF